MSNEIKIEVKEQKQLTLKETFEFCVSSIKHRFGRSLLTLAVVTLAVAFFMYLQCTNIFRNSARAGVENEIIEHRNPSRLLGMLYNPYTRTEFTRLIVDSGKNEYESARLQKILNLSESELSMLRAAAFEELRYLDYFADLPIGKRKDLYGRLQGRECLEFLTEAENFEKTTEKMLTMGGMRFPGGNEKCKRFIDSYNDYTKRIDDAYASWTEFQKKIRHDEIPQHDTALLRQYIIQASGNPKMMETWLSSLSSAGFDLTDKELNSIIRYMKMTEQIENIQTLLSEKEYRTKWRQVYGQSKYKRMDDKMAALDSFKTREMLKNAKFPGGAVITQEDMHRIAQEFRYRKKLAALELYLDIDLFKDTSGFSVSQIYLMALSFLVCVVGITNAMLMSITERFREIATLKCLGATDSFILTQIVLEALIQGVIGGLAGIVIGFTVALTSAFLQVGTRVFTTFDFSMVAYAALFSLLAGVFLSVLASLYPSTRAARMAPMEAMRVE